MPLSPQPVRKRSVCRQRLPTVPTGITAGQPPYATTSQRSSTRRGEFWVNDPSRVFVARRGRHELTPLILDAQEVRDLVERMLKSSGRRLDLSQPFVDAMLPGGHRLHVVLDGISRGFVAVNIRKFVARAHRLDDLVTLGTLTSPSAEFLDACVRAGMTVLVSGGTPPGRSSAFQGRVTAIGPLSDCGWGGPVNAPKDARRAQHLAATRSSGWPQRPYGRPGPEGSGYLSLARAASGDAATGSRIWREAKLGVTVRAWRRSRRP